MIVAVGPNNVRSGTPDQRALLPTFPGGWVGTQNSKPRTQNWEVRVGENSEFRFPNSFRPFSCPGTDFVKKFSSVGSEGPE